MFMTSNLEIFMFVHCLLFPISTWLLIGFFNKADCIRVVACIRGLQLNLYHCPIFSIICSTSYIQLFMRMTEKKTVEHLNRSLIHLVLLAPWHSFFLMFAMNTFVTLCALIPYSHTFNSSLQRMVMKESYTLSKDEIKFKEWLV